MNSIPVFPVSNADRLLAYIKEAQDRAFKSWLIEAKERDLADRIRRFLALPPQLQEGVLRYGEQLQNSYRS